MAIGVILMAACGGDPEEGSGGDAYRNVAQVMEMGEWVADNISADDADRTDWKAVDLEAPGKLSVEVSADAKGAELAVSVYDRYGHQLGATTRRSGSEGPAKVVVKTKRDGRHFIRIRQTGGGATDYSVRASVGDGGGSSVDF